VAATRRNAATHRVFFILLRSSGRLLRELNVVPKGEGPNAYRESLFPRPHRSGSSSGGNWSDCRANSREFEVIGAPAGYPGSAKQAEPAKGARSDKGRVLMRTRRRT